MHVLSTFGAVGTTRSIASKGSSNKNTHGFFLLCFENAPNHNTSLELGVCNVGWLPASLGLPRAQPWG